MGTVPAATDDSLKGPVGQTDDVLLFDSALNGSTSLLTIPEAARFLKISQPSVRRLQQQREISFLKVGGSVRFLKEDLLSYLRKRRVVAIR